MFPFCPCSLWVKMLRVQGQKKGGVGASVESTCPLINLADLPRFKLITFHLLIWMHCIPYGKIKRPGVAAISIYACESGGLQNASLLWTLVHVKPKTMRLTETPETERGLHSFFKKQELKNISTDDIILTPARKLKSDPTSEMAKVPLLNFRVVGL